MSRRCGAANNRRAESGFGQSRKHGLQGVGDRGQKRAPANRLFASRLLMPDYPAGKSMRALEKSKSSPGTKNILIFRTPKSLL